MLLERSATLALAGLVHTWWIGSVNRAMKLLRSEVIGLKSRAIQVIYESSKVFRILKMNLECS